MILWCYDLNIMVYEDATVLLLHQSAMYFHKDVATLAKAILSFNFL